MTTKLLMKGNEAVAEAAIQAGCRFYAGYPITPQSEISEYMSKRMHDIGGVFIPAESEVGAINMILGACATGTRSMTSSSSCAIALMQETIGYMVGQEVPCLIVNMSRGGPGLGSITPSQGDYFQSTKGGSNGDFRIIVLAPSSIQELVDLTYKAFDLAEKYRTPVIILGDGMLGQMAEPVKFPDPIIPNMDDKQWNLTGANNRKGRYLRSMRLNEGELQKHNINLFEKYKTIENTETQLEVIDTDDAKMIITAFGSCARIAKTAVKLARKKGLLVGLARPVTLWPFPIAQLQLLSVHCHKFLDIEMNMGQMLYDVKLALHNSATVEFYGQAGGWVPTPEELLDQIIESYNKL